MRACANEVVCALLRAGGTAYPTHWVCDTEDTNQSRDR